MPSGVFALGVPLGHWRRNALTLCGRACRTFGVCSIADCVVVTATRDGMNLVPYEYVVCRQGPDAAAATETEPAVESGPRDSMLVVSGGCCWLCGGCC